MTISLLSFVLVACLADGPCAKGHTYGEWDVVKEANCLEDGKRVRICSVCNHQEEEVIAALGHDFGDYQLVSPATCEIGGKEERKCSRCKVKEQRDIKELGHQIVEVPYEASTCNHEGHIAHFHCTRCNKNFQDEQGLTVLEKVTLDLADHTFTTNYGYDGAFHWQICDVCQTRSEKAPHQGDPCSVCGYEKLPSLREVMQKIVELRNYTYEITDQIFNVTTTLRYTENAYYYQPSQKEHGGDPYGYAQATNGDIFRYVIENSAIVPESAMRDKDGKKLANLYDEALISLADINPENLTDIATTDNMYEITDPVAKKVISALAGYGIDEIDQYVTVKIEVISKTEIKTYVTFDTGNEQYKGDSIGVIKNIGSTEIAEIADYIASGKGALVSDADKIAAILAEYKESEEYKIEVESSSKHYVDLFHEDYYYSSDALNATDQKGYLALKGKFYQFTIVDGKVAVSSEAQITDHNNLTIWAQNFFTSLNNINLSLFYGQTQEDKTVKINYNASIMNTLAGLTHYKGSLGYGYNVSENDVVVFEPLKDDKTLVYTYTTSDGQTFKVTISSLNNVSNEVIESYITSGGDLPDPNDISGLTNKLQSFVTDGTYNIKVTDAISAFSSFTRTGNKQISITKNSYYQENENDATKSFGYGEDETGVYKLTDKTTKGEYVLNNGQNVKGLYTSGLVKSLQDLNLTTIQATQNMDGTYAVTDTKFITTLLDIAGFNGASLVVSFSSAKVTVTDTSVTFVLSTTFYGSVTVVISK